MNIETLQIFAPMVAVLILMAVSAYFQEWGRAKVENIYTLLTIPCVGYLMHFSPARARSLEQWMLWATGAAVLVGMGYLIGMISFRLWPPQTKGV